jgi:Ca2+/H+ antiporter
MRSDVVPGLLIAAGAVALYVGGGLAPVWGPGANRDASFWPFVMLLLLAVLGLALALQGLRRSPQPLTPKSARVRGRASGTIAVLSYVPMLFVFGFYISTLAYAFALPPILGGVRWRSSAAFALLFTAVLYVIFTLGLRMDVPHGLIALPWMDSASG